MRSFVAVLLLVVALEADTADDVSFVNEGIVDAPVTEVWKVFSTSEGYKALGVALADVDLRVGGTIRSRYRGDGRLGDEETIENVILAYEPPTMMATRIQAPPKSFPFKEAWKNPWTVVTLTPVRADRTLVRVASLGFGSDDESVAMRRFFERGNQQTVETLRMHFAPGGATPAAAP
jgi:uncharacterized protein YndB with AHSA1/START domain